MFNKIFSSIVCFILSFSFYANADNTIRVYAAASMTNAMDEISQKFTAETGGKIVPVYASSSSLARQIERGAPADIYLSANQKWVSYLTGKGAVKAADTKIIAHNRLALITPKNNPVSGFELNDASKWRAALNGGRLAVGQTESVPAGIYAKQALISLGIWDELKKSLASVNNVRVALALVERGEADLGIVYQTDAQVSDRVTIVTLLPEESHKPVVYPVAKITDSELADQFYHYLSSEEAQQILKNYGFE